VTYINRVILAVFMLMGSVAQADSQAQLHKTLDGFHQAAMQADTDRYFATMADNVVFLGTDGSERWQGQAFRDFVQSHFAAGRGWAYTAVTRNIVIADDGQTAWFDESLHNERLGLCRGSGVLVKSGEDWKIAQYNLSVPVPNAMVHDVVADIAAMEEGGVATSDVTVDPAAPESAAAGSAPPAIAADAVTGEPAADVKQTADHCNRKRFKTNRKAGC